MSFSKLENWANIGTGTYLPILYVQEYKECYPAQKLSLKNQKLQNIRTAPTLSSDTLSSDIFIPISSIFMEEASTRKMMQKKLFLCFRGSGF